MHQTIKTILHHLALAMGGYERIAPHVLGKALAGWIHNGGLEEHPSDAAEDATELVAFELDFRPAKKAKFREVVEDVLHHTLQQWAGADLASYVQSRPWLQRWAEQSTAEQSTPTFDEMTR